MASSLPETMLTKDKTFAQAFLVSEAIHTGFIQVFNDRNPYHMEDETARNKGFAGKIMHGNILCGFLSYFVGECLPVKTVVIHSQEIHFHRPVYLNDRVTLHVTITDFFESVKTAEMRFFFDNQDGLTVAKGKLSIGFL